MAGNPIIGTSTDEKTERAATDFGKAEMIANAFGKVCYSPSYHRTSVTTYIHQAQKDCSGFLISQESIIDVINSRSSSAPMY